MVLEWPKEHQHEGWAPLRELPRHRLKPAHRVHFFLVHRHQKAAHLNLGRLRSLRDQCAPDGAGRAHLPTHWLQRDAERALLPVRYAVELIQRREVLEVKCNRVLPAP